MTNIKKPLRKRIVAKIEAFNQWLETRIKRNDELLQNMNMDDLIAENATNLKQLFRSK